MKSHPTWLHPLSLQAHHIPWADGLEPILVAPAKTVDTFLLARTKKGDSASERHKPQRTEPFLASGKNTAIYLGTVKEHVLYSICLTSEPKFWWLTAKLCCPAGCQKRQDEQRRISPPRSSSSLPPIAQDHRGWIWGAPPWFLNMIWSDLLSPLKSRAMLASEVLFASMSSLPPLSQPALPCSD